MKHSGNRIARWLIVILFNRAANNEAKAITLMETRNGQVQLAKLSLNRGAFNKLLTIPNDKFQQKKFKLNANFIS